MPGRRIRRADGPLDVTLEAPASKSVTHRVLVTAALAEGVSTLYGALDAADTRATVLGLSALGVVIRVEGGRLVVDGSARTLPGGGRLSCGDSGTTLRFLVAVAALGQAASRIDGSPRLRQRPLTELLDALRTMGARIERGPSASGLPLSIDGSSTHGSVVHLDGRQSSQFASALLLVGSRLEGGLDLTIGPAAVSLPYVELTREVLEGFGVEVECPSPRRFRVPQTTYGGRSWTIDGDHSSASYFLAAAAVVGGRVRVNGLKPDSAQPDARFGPILDRVGCVVRTGSDWVEVTGDGHIAPFDLDMTEAPDLVPTLAVLALFAEGPCRLRGIAHLRDKESDRLALLTHNLKVLGREAATFGDRLEIEFAPPVVQPVAPLRTDSDHRMAMALALAGLRLPEVEIDDPDCVLKSNPRFWRQFEQLAEPS